MDNRSGRGRCSLLGLMTGMPVESFQSKGRHSVMMMDYIEFDGREPRFDDEELLGPVLGSCGNIVYCRSRDVLA